jgi:hypothetical protein
VLYYKQAEGKGPTEPKGAEIMTRKELEIFVASGTASHKSRMEHEKREAIKAINDGMFAIAAMHITHAEGHKQAIEELSFLLETMEVE